MQMNFKTVGAEQVFPILGVFEGIMLSRKGVLTIGWELTFPPAYSIQEKEYDDMLENFANAVKCLPAWTMVHRQDIYLYDEYRAPENSEKKKGFLEASYDKHFEGRRYLTHRAYLYISHTARGNIEKGGRYSGLFGITPNVNVPELSEFSAWNSKCNEFIQTLTTGKQISCRQLTKEDWLGDENSVGIVQKYMMLGNDSFLTSNIEFAPHCVGAYDKYAHFYVIGESEHLPSTINSISRVQNLSSINNDVYLSYGSKLGILLDCEHVLNYYVVVPNQAEILGQLKKECNKMVSGISSNDNRLNAAEIQDYLDDAYQNSLITVKAHLNVMAWGDANEQQDIIGKISAAISDMGATAKYENYAAPLLYYAGIPGNGYEISKENLMKMELRSSLTLTPYETFDSGIPGGMMRICDRMRNIPIPMDTQKIARNMGIIDNYNTFVLGGSGTGKSFFTNFYLRNCYDAGENVFIIDVGDSYEGLCAIINEESNGRDGAYLSWDKEHPFSFNPFLGYEAWLGNTGGLNTDDNGVNFFMSFVQTAWAPTDGWTSASKTILTQIIVEFLHHIIDNDIKEPIFEDFYRFVDGYIADRIRYQAPTVTRGGKPRNEEDILKDNKKNGYWIDSTQITENLFDISNFLLSLKNYSLAGSYSFLLNDHHPKDLFTSRFSVFEVDKLSQDDNKFYSLCILCIMNAFERKMRGTPEFKVMVIEEAWKAISNETMAPYLAGLWKTARKFNTAAMVVTQEIDDIINSPVIKTAILDNSSVKILLDQSNHMNTFDRLQEILSLTQKDKDIILSMNRSLNTQYGKYKEVFFNLGGKRSFVAATEVSPQEAMAFESAKDQKAPMLKKTQELGSCIRAIQELTTK